MGMMRTAVRKAQGAAVLACCIRWAAGAALSKLAPQHGAWTCSGHRKLVPPLTHTHYLSSQLSHKLVSRASPRCVGLVRLRRTGGGPRPAQRGFENTIFHSVHCEQTMRIGTRVLCYNTQRQSNDHGVGGEARWCHPRVGTPGAATELRHRYGRSAVQHRPARRR